jgi:hypothetical protein
MSLFRLKFFEFVNKPKSVQNLERSFLELVNALNDKQKILSLFISKLVFTNDVYVLNINNYTKQINSIKIGHHSCCKYLKHLLNQYYIRSSEIVDTIEDILKTISKLDMMKNKLIKYYMLYDSKPTVLRYHLMNNPTYQGELIRLLMLIQRFNNLYFVKTKNTKIIDIYMNNALSIQDKLVNIYKDNPYELTNFAANSKFINAIKKQMTYLKKLMNNFNGLDIKFNKQYNTVNIQINLYKKELDIPPILLNINNRKFGTYGDLLRQRYVIMQAINKQIDMLQREVIDIYNRDKVKYDPKMFLYTKPNLINLLGQKEVLTKGLVSLPETVNLTISELEHCLSLSEKDIEECIRSKKIRGGNKSNNNDNKLSKTGDLINYLKHKQLLEKNNNKIKIALRTLYNMQKQLTKNSELNEAIRQAERYEAGRLSAFGKYSNEHMNLINKSNQLNEQINYMHNISNKPLEQSIVGGNDNNNVSGGNDEYLQKQIKKLGEYNNMLISSHQIRERNIDTYNQLKLQYANYINKKIAEGSSKNMDQLLREAYAQDIYNYVTQELKICTRLSMDEIKNIDNGKLIVSEPPNPLGQKYDEHKKDIKINLSNLFPNLQQQHLPSHTRNIIIHQGGSNNDNDIDGGKSKRKSKNKRGSKTRSRSKNSFNDLSSLSSYIDEPVIKIRKAEMLPNTLKEVVMDKLHEQNKTYSIFPNINEKLEALFGPTSEQYNFIKSVVNNAVTDYKTQIMKRYYGNYSKIENEFLRVDVCANNIKEKLYKHIDIYPDYDSLCQTTKTFIFDIKCQEVKCFTDTLEQLLNCSYTCAYGYKKYKEHLYKQIKHLWQNNNNILQLIDNSIQNDNNDYHILFNNISLVLTHIVQKTFKVNPNIINHITANLANITNYKDLGEKIIAEIVGHIIEETSKNDNSLRIQISDYKNKISNTIYKLKTGLDNYRNYIINVYVPKLKGFEHTKNKYHLIYDILNSNPDRLNDEEKTKLRNILSEIENIINENDIIENTLKTSVESINNYLRQQMINFVNHNNEYHNLLNNTYMTNINICVELNQFLHTLNILLLVFSTKDTYTNLAKQPNTFNEDILTFAKEINTHWMVEQLTHEHNQITQYKLQFDILTSKITYESKKLDNMIEIYNNEITDIYNKIGNNCEDNIYENDIKLYTNQLLSKNINKIQQNNNASDDDKKLYQKNIQRLYHNYLKLKQDKLLISSELSIKMHNIKDIIGNIKISNSNYQNYISEYCSTITKGFENILIPLTNTLSMMNSSYYALECIYMINGGQAQINNNEYYNEIVLLYNDVYDTIIKYNNQNLSQNITNSVNYHIKPNMDYIVRTKFISNIQKNILNSIIDYAQNIINNYNLVTDIDPNNIQDILNIMANFVAFEYV